MLPFLWWSFLEFWVWVLHVCLDLLLCGKMPNQILLKCLFIAFSKVLTKLYEPILSLSLNLALF